MSKKLSDYETEILSTILSAYEEDPSPESGRTYAEGEEDDEFEGEILYDTAMALVKRGLLRIIEDGTYGRGKNKTKYAHFGLTDKGFKAAA